GRGYYVREETSDIRSLLKLLVDSHDDLAVATVLRSPLVGLSDDGLFLLGQRRRELQTCSLWEALSSRPIPGLAASEQQALDRLAAKVEKLRRQVGRAGLARLIERAINDFDYDLCLLRAPDGERRYANVRKLMQLADDFESLEGPDLADFVGVLETMTDLGAKEGSAATLAEDEDAVRIMTIHQAKGLEFPVVVLGGLGFDLPRGDLGRREALPILVGEDGRMAVYLRHSKKSTYEEHDLAWGPAAEILAEERQRQQEEDVRLQYVAMTRAMERLVLVGAQPSKGSLEKNRIGRILQALGWCEWPPVGERTVLPGLEAVVQAVGPESAWQRDIQSNVDDSAETALPAAEVTG
ncbi:MAG: hypothetical protein H5T84_01470, partial [Thermoleophilia bacterium]|nr:hypothetical protein [Thermoleophilia bacterium]